MKGTNESRIGVALGQTGVVKEEEGVIDVYTSLLMISWPGHCTERFDRQLAVAGRVGCFSASSHLQSPYNGDLAVATWT